MTEENNTCPNCGWTEIMHYTCYYCGAEYSQDCDKRCMGCGLSVDLWPKWREMREALETIRQKSVCVALYRPYCPHCVVEKALKGGGE